MTRSDRIREATREREYLFDRMRMVAPDHRFTVYVYNGYDCEDNLGLR